MVGHPDETEEDFEDLKDFIRDVKFDRMGVFQYSHEEDTHSHNKYEDNVPDSVKQQRADDLMAIQQEISYALNQEKIGKEFKVLIDRQEGDTFIGRTEYDSYEIDNEVIVNNDDLKVGEFYSVKITSADDYDLYGDVI